MCSGLSCDSSAPDTVSQRSGAHSIKEKLYNWNTLNVKVRFDKQEAGPYGNRSARAQPHN